ncbi:hypothetical protein [Aeromicrobium sp. CF3.5]|uniref:hypothetical protein n=1 Tax=Aeromicrobium sp. CF3.5 TaxID=3373078 RepID=UPI003EE7D809
MSGPVFATRWDFLLARVVIGVDRATGVFSGSETVPGRQMVCVWSQMDLATDALHVESWDLLPIAVRDLLPLLPGGVGVVVDPERPTGMTASASYVGQLKPYVAPFPAGSEVRLADWDLPEALLDALGDVHSFGYTVDDSPMMGCVVHTSGVPGPVEAALSAWGEPAALGAAIVHVLEPGDLPEEVRAALAPARRRSWPWRR